MTKSKKITLSASRDIPFNKLLLSQSNVRQIKSGVSIEELAEDIARRTLLASLTVRPVLAEDGSETGMFEIPADGRRFRALELLVKQQRLNRTAPVPCIVRTDGLAEEDSLAENVQRAPLHPLDQFRAFQAMREKGKSEEEIAAAFFVSASVVKQRLKLAAVSQTLLDAYTEEEMTLDQLMAFTVKPDHERQEQVWEALKQHYSKQPFEIRRLLTEGAVRASDRRAQFVGLDNYVEAGGEILRDLFQTDDGGWLQDAALLETKRSPLVPVTPDEMAASALAAAKAGAAIVHLHVRDPNTGEGSRDDDLYRQVVERIRDRNCDVIINLTAGMGGDIVFGDDDPLPLQDGTDLIGPTARLSHVEKLCPDICTLDCSSYNVGDGNLVYVSTSGYIRAGAEQIMQLGMRPELEVFDLGHLRYSLKLLQDGVFDAPAMIQFCLGVPYGAPADTAAMKVMADMVRNRDVIWSAFGVGRDQLRMMAQAVLLGHHVRVGLEDNLYLKRSVPAQNDQLVTKAADIIETLGGTAMSPEETRDLLGLERS